MAATAPTTKTATSNAKARKPAKSRAAASAKRKVLNEDEAPAKPRTDKGDDLVIRPLVSDCPKRKGTKCEKEWALYKPGMTVRQFLDAGGRRSAIRWDVAHKLIALDKPAKK